jgi:hypothetical protein
MNFKHLLIFVFIFLFAGHWVSAQREHFYIENSGFLPEWRETSHGSVVIYQDVKLRSLIRQHIESNNEKFPGWRVQIYFGSGQTARDRANSAKEIFYKRFGQDYGAYIVYDSPYFKVRVGDFRTKAEAMKFRERLKPYFKSTWIIQDMVYYPDKISSE